MYWSRFRNYFKQSLLLILASVSVSLSASSDSVLRVNVCNFAPYPTHTYALSFDSNEYSISSMPLEAGECNHLSGVKKGTPVQNIRLFAQPKDSKVHKYLIGKTWYKDKWSKISKSQTWGGENVRSGLSFCKDGDNFSYAPQRDCPPDKDVVVFSGPLNFDKSLRADWIIADFALCSSLQDIDCYGDVSLDEFSIWANEVGHGLKRRIATIKLQEKKVPEKVIPTDMGIEVRDFNGILNAGVEVISAKSVTPFGTPVQLQKGDLIIQFDGFKVFSHELIKLIYDAAKKYGYNDPVDVVFIRNGELFKTQLALFFDENIFGRAFVNISGQCRAPLLTFMHSALNEFMFYRQAAASCLLDDIRNKNFGGFSACKFERDQLLAAHKQFCPKSYYTGELLGGISFLWRPKLEKIVVKNVKVLSGKSVYSRVVRAAVLEVAEESARTLFTTAPGLNKQAILEEMQQRAKVQGLIGVGFQTFPLITAGAVIPMVYNSYSTM